MKIFFFAAMLFCTGCASLGPNFDSVKNAPKDSALVYVYRPSAFTGAARSPDIILNGQKVGTSSSGSYFVFEAKPGLAVVVQRNFAGEVTGSFEASLKPGQIYFLRLDLGIPALKTSVDYTGKNLGKACAFMGLNLTLRGSEAAILSAMDRRVQSSTCWPGFMFVSEELGRQELTYTKLSK